MVGKPAACRSFVATLFLLGILVATESGGLRAQEKSRGSEAPPRTLPAVPQAPPAPLPTGPSTEVPIPAPFQGPVRFPFTIPANTPLKELLPTSPVSANKTSPSPAKELDKVPLVEFQAPLSRELAREEAMKQTAHTIAKIN